MEERLPAPAGAPATLPGFDPWDLSDPFETYARARRDAPVFFSDELGYWVVSRHEDIQEIFKHPATFSSENTQTPFRPRPPEVQRIFDEAGVTSGSGLSARQPPDHTRLRGFVKKAFTPRRIELLEPEVRSITVALIERMAPLGRGDLVTALANDLPALVIFRLLGAPDVDVAQAKSWARSRVFLNFGDLPIDEQLEHARNLAGYWRFCAALVDASFENPGDDLPGDLARIAMAGDDSLSRDEIVSLVHTQLFAGHETTTALLGGGLHELLGQHDRWRELCADPSLIPIAAEELLRLAPPVFTWKRVTTEPARVAGTDLPRGANLLLLLGSANRDAATFDAPDEIDLHRTNARSHLSFGHGIHFCLGAALARLEAMVVLQELTERLPSLRLVEHQTFTYAANSTFRGPAHVLVEWDVPGPALTRPLEQCTREDVAEVGGKATGLGELMSAGLPVPDGFAVTTRAYRAAVAQIGGREWLQRELSAVDVQDIDALAAAAAAVRATLQRTPLPADVRAAVAAAYAQLGAGRPGDPPVAVRSSATAEDSADASFAGQQDTYLWVVGEAAVLDAVRRCWASLFSARSIAYRRSHGIADGNVEIAVVVQAMVRADAAGVAMTLNPSNGDRGTVAVESSWGLGETVVGGAVTPDRFLLDKVVLEITQTTISDKHVELIADPAGGRCVERPVDAERRLRPSLTVDQVRSVAQLAKRAEKHFGCPQDVEWALEGDTVTLLQSRPETVWSRKPAIGPRSPSAYRTGLAGIVDTLNNPLAARGER